MRCERNFQIFFILPIIFIGILWYTPEFIFAQAIITPPGTITIDATVPGCGDGIIQTGEECDGSNLNNQTCFTLGFWSGTLSCNPNCTFNTSACDMAFPALPVGGGVWYIYPPAPAPEPELCLPTGDFNNDNFINFIDLSILLFWFGKTGPQINCVYDLNNDGKIDFIDISILLYRWEK